MLRRALQGHSVAPRQWHSVPPRVIESPPSAGMDGPRWTDRQQGGCADRHRWPTTARWSAGGPGSGAIGGRSDDSGNTRLRPPQAAQRRVRAGQQLRPVSVLRTDLASAKAGDRFTAGHLWKATRRPRKRFLSGRHVKGWPGGRSALDRVLRGLRRPGEDQGEAEPLMGLERPTLAGWVHGSVSPCNPAPRRAASRVGLRGQCRAQPVHCP
jgi:hypothetical protein